MKPSMNPKLGSLAKRFGVIGLLLAVLTGCVPVALHPFYTQKDIVFDSVLLGVWAENDDAKESWTFEAETNRSYRVTIKEKKRSDYLDGFLFKLGTNTFLDLAAGERTYEENNLETFSAIHLLPAHSLAQVRLQDAQLTLAFMDHEWLKTYLEKNPDAIQHTKVARWSDDEQLVLTAPTHELQQFVQKHLDEAFLKDADSLKRISSKP